VRFWLHGATHGPDALDPALRQKVFEMTRLGFSWENEKAEGGWLVADRRARMGEISAPTLVLVGELDQPDFVAIADAIAGLIPGARVERLPGVAHLPPMEDPEGFVAAVVPFFEA
jgi:pimeloyl-ACP methyl ester carboxylesterase